MNQINGEILKESELLKLLDPPEEADRHWFQERGRTFERILNKMLSKEKMEPRTSMRPSGEEIDGSFAIGNAFYLLEAKWHASPIPASALYSFKGKVDGKLIGTIGVFFSMSDYSKDAVDALLSGKELNLILFGHRDILFIDSGKITLREAMRIKLRYAASYGQPFYPLETYLPETQQVDHGFVNQTTNQQWSIIVEGENDAHTLKVLLERFDIGSPYSVIAAGGHMAVAQLAEYLVSNNSANVAAIITPISDLEVQKDQLKRLADVGAHTVVLTQDIEGWLDNYVSVEYHNATFLLSDYNGKMARRYARHADIQKLLSDHSSFSELMLKLNAYPKNQKRV